MANRNFQTDGASILKGVVRLYCTFTYTASGTLATLKKWNYGAAGGATPRTYSNAPTTTGINNYQKGEAGILSVARTGTGLFTVTLQDKYQRVLACGFTTVSTSGVATDVVMALDATTDVTAATPVIKLVFSSSSTTAAAPADGDQFLCWFDLQNASEP